jgi:hypothetical protein
MLSKDKLNSRKLGVFLVCFSTATALLIAKLLEAEHWVTVCITVGGAYMATQAYVDGK